MSGSVKADRRERILRAAVRQGLLRPDTAVLAGFVDLDAVNETVASLHGAFPASSRVLHAFAAKANCLVPVLEELRRSGMGCEVASAGELAGALEAGFDPAHIVFDSPAKSRAELAWALSLGVAVNADSFQEITRLDEILAARGSDSRIGVRVNPQIGAGSITAMSTATATSKFGIPLGDEGNRRRLLRTYRDRPWLTRVHTHVGSQGCPLDLIARGVAKAVEFAEEVNAHLGRRQVTGIDIGGGLPVNFDDDETRPGFDTYVEHLREHAPALFSGGYEIVTEFGRSVMAKNGFIATFVEYTKTVGGRPVAITHAGAQVATRTVFAPDAWPLRIEAHGPDGRAKHGRPVPQDVAGPCCFAGDLLARDRALPLLDVGDIVVVPDTGAYYFSTHFHYNSLPEPAVHGARIDAGGRVTFRLLRPAQEAHPVPAPAGP
ncbi:diaminopimelate decarboxylase [Streptomyces somaliensis DSM 40738]|uniref:Diaminopimelate decarboxylase n=1 Tax=Streptomyces somaliensis (strain ATCC 33201 / DSM 40738 / JCM 12659 / KCTC 9044 / NCTC 11332 / NRRL B-12077 / IP 733) TaxID=1134445 RepID=A0AA44D9F5_STRE0|nr:diaminopimelate decarboxylase [Streptomyces somaliensis]MCQ0024322.1 diaminopimelate decarboxylase [Streptomyces somaliensis DSM 40738]NKY12691.1 diaminopimelate decarboxylase [Streptomyces somaliensis DSM 40738]